ncbi:MAG: hypothetical protein KDJ86_03860 [Bauldia sp.]|uniref:SH3 domain-containing protein n=1 Tax=Bauldia sp. TaxID=2575872 RepID=UPI001D519558|nr:SH3 domain-containing protein [Bauldia sp.]MCB1494899.1 hypothetical protein [Bauldia sp.]
MIRSATIAALMVAGLAVPALADQTRTAVTDGLFVNIRSGPGMKYEPICLAWPNVRFEVETCDGNWCLAHYLQSEGWMSRKHIVFQD